MGLGSLVGQMGLFQLILDGALLLCLVLLIVWMRRTPARIEGRQVLQTAEEFMAASEKLNAEFEKNLEQKKTLIKELMTGLDQRSGELRKLMIQAEEVLSKLEKAGPELSGRLDPGPRFTPKQSPKPALGDKEKDVLSLFRQGLPVSRIASQLRLPKGEVELILGLHHRG